MNEKENKIVNLEEEINNCQDSDGNMTKLPIFTRILSIDGEIVGELEGYMDTPRPFHDSIIN